MKHYDAFFIVFSFDEVRVSFSSRYFLSIPLLSSSSVYTKTNHCCCCQKHKRHHFWCALGYFSRKEQEMKKVSAESLLCFINGGGK